MRPKTFMVIAGEPSGDLLAAELVRALREEIPGREASESTDCQPLRSTLEPRFFGAGGQKMAEAGVDLAVDMTPHSVVGFSDVLKSYLTFRRLFNDLVALALARQPDAIICVDFSGFNRRFAHAMRQRAQSRQDWFHVWKPKLIQYVSPQVWASREGRAWQMARDYDLVVSILPFEKEWYARRVPRLRVEFVGNPIIDRYPKRKLPAAEGSAENRKDTGAPKIVLLPGSRTLELTRHLPVMARAFERIAAALPGASARIVLPNNNLTSRTAGFSVPNGATTQTGGLAEALAEADLAIASTGTVTLECALFGVPTVALYKTSWATYAIARSVVKVKHIALPNLLANEEIFPELIQGAATPENIARSALDLLRNPERRNRIQAKLAEIVGTLGPPGASRRAAKVIAEIM